MSKRYSPKFKFQVVLEALSAAKSSGSIAKAYGVHPNTLSNWRQTVIDKGPELFAKDNTVADYEKRLADMERLIGKKEVEIALSPALRAGACVKNFLGQRR